MANNPASLYNPGFYSQLEAGTAESARIVLGLLYEFYRPASVLDVGCGQGAWLAAAESLGSTRLRGMDGNWVRRERLLSPSIEFVAVEFEKEVPTATERFDLCMSLEVAEHIGEEHSERFVDLLCKSSDLILFSAAIKHQVGTHHVNGQWQSYWAKKFAARGYECLDILRPRLWDSNAVEYYYRQNVLLYMRKGLQLPRAQELWDCSVPILDIVHPVNFERQVELVRRYQQAYRQPTLRYCVGCMLRFLKNRVSRVQAQEEL